MPDDSVPERRSLLLVHMVSTPYVHKKDNVKGLFHAFLSEFPASSGIHLWEKCAFANPELRTTKNLRDLCQKFFAVLDPYKQGRLVSDDFNTVIKRTDLVGKSLTSRLNDARKDKVDNSKVPDKGKRSDLNTTRIYGQHVADANVTRSGRGLDTPPREGVSKPTVAEEDTRTYTDEEFDCLMAAMAEEKIKPCHAFFQNGICESRECIYDHNEKAMQTLLKKRIWDLAKAAKRPDADKFLSYVEYAVKKVDEEKLAASKST